VAWELSKGTDGDGWGQNIAEGESHDKHPHFTQAPDKDYDTTEVYRVTFHSTNLPVDQKLYVDPGDNVDLPWLPENAKWYDADGQEFNGLNIQCDVDAIAGLRILFAGEMKTVEVAGIYSPLEQILPVNLNQYVQYADNGPSSDDRFEYTIIGDHDAFHATLGEDGRTLTIPAGTNVNETGYALTVQVHEKEPYIMPLSLGDFGTDDVVLNIRVIINKATPLIVVKPTVSEIRYGQSLRESALSGGEAQHPTAGVNVPGAFAWEKDSAIPTVPEAAAVGYAVTFTPGDTKNYNAVTTMVTLPVNKVNPTMMKEPEPKGGVYNGVAQELVEPGIAANGTMMYSLEKDGEYLPDSPARANADNYTVWYKVVGDENHNDLGPFSVEVTIRPYPVSIASQTVTYNGTQSFTVVLEGVNNETVVANLKPYSKDAGVYTYAAEEEGGKYTVGLSSSNYAVENGGELLINKLQAVLHWRHPLVFIHDNQPHEVAAVVSNAVEGDAVELLYQTDLANKITNSATDEGSYTAVVERLENSNYTLDGVQNASQRWYIIEKNENYKLSADRSEEIVYGDVLNLAFTISSDALREYPDGQIVFLVNGEKIGEPDNTSEAAGGLIATKAVKMTSANNFSAGANTVMAIYSDAEDGPHGFDAVSVWVIPKPIKAEVTGNAAKTYDGNDVAANLILELDGVEDCDEKAVTVAADSFTYSSKNVNEAATIIANQVVLSGARSGNYTLTSPVETVGRITARAVRLEWSGYEGLVYTGTPSMLRPRPQN
ncbi:MAG: hypothetical protein J1E43_11515, partial [Christensenellaceae bacterium]|nr:hypothetical protein [Christensenellaceae bacterium]